MKGTGVSGPSTQKGTKGVQKQGHAAQTIVLTKLVEGWHQKCRNKLKLNAWQNLKEITMLKTFSEIP